MMKKTFYLVILLVISFASSSQILNKKLHKEYNLNNELITIGNLNKNGEKDGKWIYLYDNKVIKEFGYYRNGVKTAEWQKFDVDGKLTNISYYELDHRPTGWTVDQIVKTDSFAINTRSCTFELFYPNGQLQSEGKYKNGYRQGKWRFYHETGELKGKKHYNKYKMVRKSRSYYANGNKKLIAPYENGKLVGKQKHFDENGNLNAVGKFTADEYKGEYTFYDENKNIVDGNKAKYNDFYMVSTDGEKTNEFYSGDTVYLIVKTEFSIGKMMNLQMTDDEYEGTIFILGKVGLYNSAIDDIEITNDSIRIQLISNGHDPDALTNKE